MHEAWDYWYSLPSNLTVIVAVIDTGMDYRFSDVTDNLVGGVDTANGDYDPKQEKNIHGTAVTATI
jgi:subtilisin family serine protease